MSDLREEIGFVPQKGVLFSGTIASNLRFGNDDATDEEIKKAARIAQATEFIEAKDDNEDLFLNEAADLMYHYIVLLIAKGYGLEDVVRVLEERHGKDKS